MNKNEIFTFTAPNGVEVTAIMVAKIHHECNYKTQVEKNTYLCYAQNRLFTIKAVYTRTSIDEEYGEILVDYAILPDYDDMLKAYSDHQVTLAEEQSGM